MCLQKEYSEETGRKPTESIGGWRTYTEDYVKWLEDKINKED